MRLFSEPPPPPVSAWCACHQLFYGLSHLYLRPPCNFIFQMVSTESFWLCYSRLRPVQHHWQTQGQSQGHAELRLLPQADPLCGLVPTEFPYHGGYVHSLLLRHLVIGLIFKPAS